MKQLFILCFFLSCASHLFSQKEANIWYFGNKAGLDFNSGAPVPLTDGKINTVEGCASIADANGELLFYTDGITVWNKNHQVMENGTGLKGDPSSTQSGIIVPKPNDNNTYYIFTVDASAGNGEDGLNYYEVNLTANNGLGKVIDNNGNQLIAPSAEKVTAVKHANGQDIWVLTQVPQNNEIQAFLVTENGVSSSPIRSEISNLVNNPNGNIGYMKASPDGTHLVCVIGLSNAKVVIYKLDTSTGKVSDEIILGLHSYTYGAEFSPDSKLLYTTDKNQGNSYIYQFNLSSYSKEDIEGSKIIIDSYDNSSIEFYYGCIQNGPDGKIYVTALNSDNEERHYLSVINEPNKIGVDCDFNRHSLYLETGITQAGLPTFIQSYFNIGFEAEHTCYEDQTTFSLTGAQVSSITWNFGDPASGSANTSTELTPNHIFSAPGDYTVTAIGLNENGDADTFTQVITIFPNPNPNQNTTFTVCSGSDTATFPLSDIDAQLTTEENETVTYYSSEASATAGTDALASPHTMQDGTLYARLQNTSTGCFAVTSLEVDVNFPIPITTESAELTECEATDGSVRFTLTDANTLLTAETAVTITYHSTQEEADNNENPLDTTVTSAGTIYARVENNIGCYSTVPVTLTAHSLPTLNSINKTYCSSTAEKTITFSDYTEEITTETVTLSYFLNQELAESNQVADRLPDSYAVSTQTIVVRAENSHGCVNYSTIDFTINTFPSVGENQTDTRCFTYNTPNQTIVQLADYSTALNLTTGQTIRYYDSEANAEAGTSTGEIAATANQTITSTTTYYARIENADNTCFLLRTITIAIEESFAVNTAERTDCVNTGQAAIFDLSGTESELVAQASDYSFTYYNAAEDAENSVNAIQNPSTYSTTESKVIYVNVTNENGCTIQTSIQLTVNPNPNVEPQEQTRCSEENSSTFDLSEVKETLQGDENYQVVFYEDEQSIPTNDAITDLNYTSTTRQIYAVVKNTATNCQIITTVDLVVNNYPSAEDVSYSYCSLELPVDLSVSTVQRAVNRSESVSIHRTRAEAEQNSNAYEQEIPITATSTLYARVVSEQGCEVIKPVEIEVIENKVENLPVKYECKGDVIRLSPALEVSTDGEYAVEDTASCILTNYNYVFKDCSDLCQPQIPTGFSPNGDGMNDYFQVFTPDIAECVIEIEQILIFNRWGNIVYEGTEAWNGQSPDGEVMTGEYLYKVIFSSKSRYGDIDSKVITGQVNLLK